MADSTQTPTTPRPRNRAKFPLGKHNRGLWYKKVGGRFFYFEKIADDPDGKQSLRQWLDEREHIIAYGERPASCTTSGTTIHGLCNHWIGHKKALLECGDLAKRTYDEYFATCEFLMATLGKTFPAKTCGPKHFEQIRVKLAKKYNPNGQAKRITQIRSIFDTAYEDRVLDDRPNFGRTFRKPKAAAFRRLRNEKGDQSYTPDEIRALLGACSVNMRAMVLLGLQAGMGNEDCAALPRSAIKDGWLTWARVKNAIPRRIPLWPETAEAIEAAIRHADSKGEKSLCFMGRRGTPYITDKLNGYRVGGEFTHTRARAGIDSQRTFYDLRRTFETVASETADQVAVDAIMGHTPSESNMAARYRQRISDDRLRAVVEYVRQWLGEIPPAEAQQ